MTLRLTARAHVDIKSIAEYLTEHEPSVAPNVMQRLEQTLQYLAIFPHMGRSGYRKDTREIAVPRLKLMVVYRQNADMVEVLTIFHSARDPSTK